MSTMAGNPHYGGADFHKQGTDADQRFAAIEATLALAYEQRTANLIAVFGQLQDGDDGVTFLGERIDGYELAKQIQERLGL